MREEILEQFGRFRRRHLKVRGWDLFLDAAFVATVAVAAMLLLDRLAFELGLAAPHLSRPEMIFATMGGALLLAVAFAGATLGLRPTPPVDIALRLDRAVRGEERFISALEVADGSFAGALCDDAARVARGAEPSQVVPRVPIGHRWGILLALLVAFLLLLFPVRLYPAPVAAFDAWPDRGPAPLEVSFEDGSIGAINTFDWDFGDGAGGSGETATHVYEKPGRYTMRLRLSGPGGASEATREIEILPGDRAAADFEADVTKGRAPLEVRFRNLSLNAKRYEWDFGDGVASAAAEPVHTYTQPGRYAVRLRAVNDIGTDERVREKYVKVAHPDEPLADFRALNREGEAPLTVSFQDMTTGAATEWRWDFGDVAAGADRESRERNPSHTYRLPGRYTVRLTAKGPHGEDLQEKPRYVHVRDEGSGGGRGGGGKVAGAPPKPRNPGGAPGRETGEKSARPNVTFVPEGVTPHTQGGELTEQTKVFGKTGGGAGAHQEVPYTSLFPAYARAAEDSIDRERIPPAVRDTVRRYFENIRPK